MPQALGFSLFHVLIATILSLACDEVRAGSFRDVCHQIAARLHLVTRIDSAPASVASPSLSPIKNAEEISRIVIPGNFNVHSFRLDAQKGLPPQVVAKIDEYLLAFKETGGRIENGSWGLSLAEVGPDGTPRIRMNTVLKGSKMLPELAATLLHEIDHVLVMQRQVRSYRRSNPTKSASEAWKEIARGSSNPGITEHLESRAANLESWVYEQLPEISKEQKVILSRIHHYPQREALRRILLWEEHTLARIKDPKLSRSSVEALESKLKSLRLQKKSSLDRVIQRMKEVETEWGNPYKMFGEHFEFWRSFGFQDQEFFNTFRSDFMKAYFLDNARQAKRARGLSASP